jgi:precorrin-2 dehydrogenase/sirohydrochlorin ferrochelatase
MTGLYPIFLNLAGKKCLVAGGGAVAARKVESLAAAGAAVTVVAPMLCPAARALVDKGSARWIEGPFTPQAMDGATLVIAATNVDVVNREVSRMAAERGIPVNVVDQPELCSFFVPSVARRGGLVIAISTSGKSPAVAKRLRKKFEKDFGPEWAVYLEMMGRARERAMAASGGQKRREEMLNRLADSDLFDLVKNGDMETAQKRIEEMVKG